MKIYTSIFSTILISIASFFGFVPQDNVLPLQNRVTQLEQKLGDQEESFILGGYNVTGGGTYRLKSSAGLADSTINLSSFKEPVSNLPYTMTYLNTDIGYGTVEPTVPDRSEFISFTGITQNSDGSAQLTGVTRGLTRTPRGSSCTASTTLAIRHPAQSTFIYTSDSPCHFAEYAVKRNDETVSGQWGFPYPSASSSVATKGYVDTLALGGNPTVNQLIVTGTAGETLYAGQIVYLKQSDARWYKAGVAIAEATSTILGVAQGAGTAGVSISGGVLLHGIDTNNIGLTAGAYYFLSSTAGATSTATSTRPIGRARTTSSLYFDTSSMYNVGSHLPNIFSNTNIFTNTTTFTGSTIIGASTATGLSNIASTTVYATTTSGTWTKPSNLRYLIVEGVGGGGGGGGNTSAYNGSGGGGGGGYAKKVIPVGALGATETVTIGAGGAAGAGTGGNGGTGGTTSFGSHISVTGGVGGTTDGSNEGTGGAGGTSTSGDVNIPGSLGGKGSGPNTGTTASVVLGGNGGSSMLGHGAGINISGYNDADPGSTGGLYGGGGSGAASDVNGDDSAGGAGAAGVVIFTYVFY